MREDPREMMMEEEAEAKAPVAASTVIKEGAGTKAQAKQEDKMPMPPVNIHKAATKLHHKIQESLIITLESLKKLT